MIKYRISNLMKRIFSRKYHKLAHCNLICSINRTEKKFSLNNVRGHIISLCTVNFDKLPNTFRRFSDLIHCTALSQDFNTDIVVRIQDWFSQTRYTTGINYCSPVIIFLCEKISSGERLPLVS